MDTGNFLTVMRKKFPNFMPSILIIDVLGKNGFILSSIVSYMFCDPWNEITGSDPESKIFIHGAPEFYDDYENYLTKIDYDSRFDCIILVSLNDTISEEKLTKLSNNGILIDSRQDEDIHSSICKDILKNQYYKIYLD